MRQGPTRESPRRTVSIWHSVKMVGWSFFGVRKNSGLHDDMARANPVHIVVVSIAAVVVLVVGLIVLVNWVVAK